MPPFIHEADFAIRDGVNRGGQISPARLAVRLRCSWTEAKHTLERAADRGLVRALRNGWYELCGVAGGLEVPRDDETRPTPTGARAAAVSDLWLRDPPPTWSRPEL